MDWKFSESHETSLLDAQRLVSVQHAVLRSTPREWLVKRQATCRT